MYRSSREQTTKVFWLNESLCKLQIMKIQTEAKEDSFISRVPKVTVDPELEKYRGKVLFPEQLKKAEEMLKNVKLPADIIEKP